jgi:hypothetical protein
MKKVEREIEVLRHMIDLLNRCLIISLKNVKLSETKSILKDIQTCKKELNKLIKARDEQKESAKDVSN